MPLEFDYEAAILQTALKSVIKKYSCINSLEYNQRRSALEIVRRSYQDIVQIREDDCLSELQKCHKDRKLVFGLMCSIYREKVEYWYPGECFESFRDVYPSTSWPFLLEIIKTFQWSDFLIEVLDSTHPESLNTLLNDIVTHLITPDDDNIPILLRILSILTQKMLSFHCKYNLNAFTDKRILHFEDHINTISSFIAQQLTNRSQWQSGVLYKYYTNLFSSIFDCCNALLNNDDNETKIETTSEITSNVLIKYEDVLNEKEKCDPQLLTEKSLDNLQWLIKFYQLCYDSLLLLDLNEMKQLLVESGGKLGEKNSSLLDLKVYLSALNSKPILCEVNRFRETVTLLQLIHQRMELLFKSVIEVGSKVVSNVISVIDGRNRRYEEYLDQLIINSSLLKQMDYLECLKRNYSLINEQRAHNLIKWLLSETNKPDFAVEYIQQVILSAFTNWPLLVRQKFQHDCLIWYNEEAVLMTSDFEEELTRTFNTFVCADVKAINNLSVQMGRLCLQSSRKTIAQTIFLAMNSSGKAQGDTLALLLKSVLCYSCVKETSVESKMTCVVLNEALLNYRLTETQFQKLKTFICKLLKSKQNELPLITCADFMRICVLPYLDRWDPGQGSRITLYAIQLLQIVLNTDSFVKSSHWPTEFKPSILACYLANIIGQCKVIRRNGTVTCDCMQIKMQAVATLNKLISLITQNLAFIKRNEVLWLCSKLESVDEFLAFYFVNLFDHFNVNLGTMNYEDSFQALFELSCCNDNCMKRSLRYFENLVKNVGNTAEQQLIISLSKVLPCFIIDEWKRVANILEHIFRTNSLIVNWKPFAELTTKDGLNFCCVSSLIISAIYLSNRNGFNVHFMMQCYRSIIKEKLDSLEATNVLQHSELASIAAELFFQTYVLMKFFTSESIEEGFILLMELSQIYMKSNESKYIKKMRSVVRNMKETTYQSTLLKILNQTS